MGSVWVEVVTGAIKIHWQQKNRIEAVLLAIGLGLYKQHLFCETVGGVGFFRITIPEALLLEWKRRVFWVGADRADGDKLRNAVTPAVFHHLGTHYQVVVEKLAGAGAIGPDAADFGSKMDDDIRVRVSV